MGGNFGETGDSGCFRDEKKGSDVASLITYTMNYTS